MVASLCFDPFVLMQNVLIFGKICPQTSLASSHLAHVSAVVGGWMVCAYTIVIIYDLYMAKLQVDKFQSLQYKMFIRLADHIQGS